VEQRLKQSLHAAVSIALNLEKQDYQVARPWSSYFYQENHQSIPLTPDLNIEDIFDNPDLRRRLLILGDPGSGKTTMMLELAEKLLKRAFSDPEQPIPVILNLASWKNPSISIFDWSISEMKQRYSVPYELAEEWLSKNQILVFLDGLDEVVPQEQQECVLALNRWLSEDLKKQAAGIVVCCRSQEYETLTQATQDVKLELHGAIFIRPLSLEQIQEYLQLFGLHKIWRELQSNQDILDLLRTPLFLSMFGLIQTLHPESFLKEFSNSANKMNSLFEIYIRAMFYKNLIIDQSRSNIKRNRTYRIGNNPHDTEVLQVLCYTSKIIDQGIGNGVDILIEDLQPFILPGFKRVQYRILASILLSIPPAFIFGIVIGTLSYLEPSLSDDSIISKLILFPVGLCLGLFMTLLISPAIFICYAIPGKLDKIEPVESISLLAKDYNFNFKRILIGILREIKNMMARSILICFVSCSTIGSLIGILFSLNHKISGSVFLGVFAGILLGMIAGLSLGLIIAFTFGLTRGAIKGLVDGLKYKIEIKIEPNQAIKNSLRNSVRLLLCLVIICMLSYIPSTWLLRYLGWDDKSIPGTIWLTCTTLAWSTFHESGGKAFIQHLALRIVLKQHHLIPRRYDLVLDYATERRFLQRFGGRYRFLHRLLQEYFSNRSY
jgi:DNA polymerase III delta prime subunit